MAEQVNEHARALGQLGAAKGGQARANVLTPNHRREIAQRAARARWSKDDGSQQDHEQASDWADQQSGSFALASIPTVLPQSAEQASKSADRKSNGAIGDAAHKPVALFPGELEIGGKAYSCYVLDNGRRVFAQREIVRYLTGVEKGNLDRYLEASGLRDFLDPDHILSQTIPFFVPGAGDAIGYEATLLIEICDAYLKAREAGTLKSNQRQLAKQAEIFVRACAKVGVIALIDEATGYQAIRHKQALRIKLQAFIADEMQEWARMFPEEFWLQLARLEGIHYSPRSRPLRWGKYVMAFVYDAMDKDVGQHLRKINPNPHHRQNHHQWLREFGRTKLNNHIHQVIGVMKVCRNLGEFKARFSDVFNKVDSGQLSLEDAFAWEN